MKHFSMHLIVWNVFAENEEVSYFQEIAPKSRDMRTKRNVNLIFLDAPLNVFKVR
jgi:hypothetical protein